MIAEYNGYCRECGDGISKGDEAHYAHGILTCPDCGPASPDANRGAAAGLEDAPGYVRVLAKRIEKFEARQQELDLAVGQAQRVMFKLTEWAVKLSAELEIDPPEVLDA